MRKTPYLDRMFFLEDRMCGTASLTSRIESTVLVSGSRCLESQRVWNGKPRKMVVSNIASTTHQP